jgi:hypothetical protein
MWLALWSATHGEPAVCAFHWLLKAVDSLKYARRPPGKQREGWLHVFGTSSLSYEIPLPYITVAALFRTRRVIQMLTEPRPLGAFAESRLPQIGYS